MRTSQKQQLIDFGALGTWQSQHPIDKATFADCKKHRQTFEEQFKNQTVH
jgi:hypothetical protein